MPTLKQEFIYFNDAVGRTLPNAKMYFYEAGTTTPKNTFTTKALTSTNEWPVVADAAGRFPVIWLGVGGYRVVVEDTNGVTIHDRDDINVADEQLNATSSIYFNTLADMKLLIAQNGQGVNPGLGDALRTAGETSTTDGLGAEWVVVAAGTGTPDDDTFVDLDNGLQAQRLFNQLYRKNNGSDIENVATFRTNVDVYSKSESDTRFINDEADSVATSNLQNASVTGVKLATNSVDSSKIAPDSVAASEIIFQQFSFTANLGVGTSNASFDIATEVGGTYGFPVSLGLSSVSSTERDDHISVYFSDYFTSIPDSVVISRQNTTDALSVVVNIISV